MYSKFLKIIEVILGPENYLSYLYKNDFQKYKQAKRVHIHKTNLKKNIGSIFWLKMEIHIAKEQYK